MLKSELYRIFKSTRGRVVSMIFILLPFMDVILNWYEDFTGYEGYEYLIYEDLSHPAFASFLSGSSRGHVAQILLIWILPIYLLIAYSDSGITDFKTGFKNFDFLRTGKKNYFISKLSASFVFPSLLTFFSLIINFIVCNIIFHGGNSFNRMETDMDSNGFLFKITFNNPIISYFVYILVFSFISGLVGVFALSVSLISRNSFIAYPIAFFVWFLQIASKYSITYTIQPFIEYGIKYFLIGLFDCILITFVSLLILYFVRIKKDEV